MKKRKNDFVDDFTKLPRELLRANHADARIVERIKNGCAQHRVHSLTLRRSPPSLHLGAVKREGAEAAREVGKDHSAVVLGIKRVKDREELCCIAG